MNDLSDPGISQQALAGHLGVLPSRMVLLLDGLEQKRLVERISSPDDRRNYALHLTPRGQQQGLTPGVHPGYRQLGGMQ